MHFCMVTVARTSNTAERSRFKLLLLFAARRQAGGPGPQAVFQEPEGHVTSDQARRSHE